MVSSLNIIMKIIIATVLLALTTLHHSGFANARIAGRNHNRNKKWKGNKKKRSRISNPVVEFSDLAIKWVKQSERGPTIASHFMVHVSTALFDAFAAFEDGTTGAITDLDHNGVRVPYGSMTLGFDNHWWNSWKIMRETSRAQLYAMTDAAYKVITTLGQTLLNQKYLEIENGEDATVLLPALMDEAKTLRDALFRKIKLKDQQVLAIAQGVSTAVSSAILTRVTEDGSNY